MKEEKSYEDVDKSEVKQKHSDSKWDISELKKISDATMNTERRGTTRGSQMTDFQNMLHLAVKPLKKKPPISESILQ